MKPISALAVLLGLSFLVTTVANANTGGDFSGGVAIGSGYAGVNTAPTNGLIIQGNVGIGTSSPITALHLLSASSLGNAPFITLENTSGSTAVDFGPGVVLQNDVTGQHGFIIEQQQDTTGNVAIADAASPYTQYFSVAQNGNVGIANTSPSHLLHVGTSSASGIVMELQNSSGACTYNPGASSVTVSCSSDIRLKTDIQDSKDALAWIDALRIRDFTVKATGERKTGVVAQEVLLTYPDMVHKDEHDTYLVDEPNPWKLARTIQELHTLALTQQEQINRQKNEINELKQQLTTIRFQQPARDPQ
jgi:hypothetical protein